MIHFFKHKRKKLLEEQEIHSKSDKTKPSNSRTTQPFTHIGRYFKYAIGEIILVVVGILIALQINNWNENQKLKTKTNDYYEQLLDDLDNDIISAEYIIEEFSNHQNQYNHYLSLYDQEGLSPIKAYHEISQLTLISTPITFNTNTIEALQNSGDIGLIPSEIRNKLMNLRRLQNLTIKRFEDTSKGQQEITQKLSALLGATTLPKRLVNQPEMTVFFNIDNNLKELIFVYEGIHRWKSISQLESIERLKDMQEEIRLIKQLIKTQLKT